MEVEEKELEEEAEIEAPGAPAIEAWGAGGTPEPIPGQEQQEEDPGKEEEDPEKKKDEEEQKPPEPTLEERLAKSEEERKGIYGELKETRSTVKELKDKIAGLDASGGQPRTYPPGYDPQAPYGYKDIIDDDTGEVVGRRPITVEERREQPLTKGEYALILKGQEDEFRTKREQDERRHKLEIDALRLELAEDKFVEEHPDYSERKARALEKLKDNQYLRLTIEEFQTTAEKIKFYYDYGKADAGGGSGADIEKIKKDAFEAGKAEGQRLVTTKVKGNVSTGAGGTSASPAPGVGVDLSKEMSDKEFNKLSLIDKEKYLQLHPDG